MEQDGDTWTMPPFWAAEYRDRRRLRRSYSLLRTSMSLLVLFFVLALVFSLIVVPTVQSFASNIFKPRTVKNSWDFLNLVLVLFAIICGFLGRNTSPETLTPRSGRTFSNPSTQPPTWYQYDYSYGHTPRRSFNRLRSFSSYPDLRQQIPSDERFRFYDDTYLLQHRHPRNDAEEEVKEIGIDNVVTASPQQGTQTVRRNVHRAYQVETGEKHETDDLDATISQPPPAIQTQVVLRNVNRLHRSEVVEKHETNDSAVEEISLSPPSTPPPAARTHGVRRNAKRTFQADTIEKLETKNLDSQSSQPSPSSHPLPRIRKKGVQRNAKPERDYSAVKSTPPPPPPQPAEAKTGQVKKKRGTATIEFLTSLRGKKKKLRQRSVENFESILNSETLLPQPPAPPPPPPKVFQNLFSLKKGKHKTTHNVRVAITGESNKRESGSSSGLKNKVMMAGNESPLNPIPPPPPLPPFKLPGWKFRVQGDYVRVDSIGSSRSGSPDLEEVSVDTPTASTHDERSQVNSPLGKHGEDSASVSAPSLFCPSPDVDTKAHNFIESFRAGLRMAKMNSMNERQGIGRSNLGTFTTP
ncbi:hypothetical protein LR48_Vigan346s001900 [Vigna angularis]|uniref:Uncharacterized protein n=2 Tax=Phaseolus angularis TaxID=3914 RepID=A0A0L9T8N0_PHAAN|nr:uncharacterized protein LOC108320209 isoform X1 [Vigna angularis]XP_052723941.1 uncharacterized protein LOC108320209 isoform X1 [Vigna angularis]XP_052723942.1 uncharacterized protein LOC108320209 isoform X1 [Vigna angularis]XP_052723943.1 uncharacterized protein LOC108320209 isoform X1 [Vigna angularis]BAT98347.1 hypothetical protein VIGAN_09199400 [Vigna angularis var. angularis]KAG2379974.1 uncharacterized protein HKW66_Vig0167530 [Vigna angularis]KOM26937.1 hypothetical protein LR48_Vi